MAAHIAKSYDQLLGKLQGISDTTLKAHFTLYQGYVKKVNEIREKLPKADKTASNFSYSEYAELRRREPEAANGAVLHELYFENLAPDGQPSPDLKKAIDAAFGSHESWVSDFKACGNAAPGWVMLTWDTLSRQVRNNLIHTEHDSGLFAGNVPLLVMDVWEHAYFFDYQTKKPDYLTAFLNNLNWKAVNERYAKCHGWSLT